MYERKHAQHCKFGLCACRTSNEDFVAGERLNALFDGHGTSLPKVGMLEWVFVIEDGFLAWKFKVDFCKRQPAWKASKEEECTV